MRKAKIIYNPTAGRFPSGMLAERAAQVLQKQGWQLTLEQTRSSEHITQIAYQAAQDGLDALFVVGGDGSVNLALAGLIGSDTALAVLPAGTANVWAQELGLPGLSWARWLALEESADLLAEAEIRTIDVGLCNDKPFLLWAGVGLDAFIVNRIEPRNRWEKHFSVVQYAASAAWNASFWHGINLQVEVEGKEISGHFLLAVVSNIHLYAGGLAELAPNARLDDGLMDLWLFKGETLGDTVQRLWDLLSGRHLQSDHTLHFSFKSLSLKTDSRVFLQLDGEPAVSDGSVMISVLPQSLRILVPQRTPHQLFKYSIQEERRQSASM